MIVEVVLFCGLAGWAEKMLIAFALMRLGCIAKPPILAGCVAAVPADMVAAFGILRCRRLLRARHIRDHRITIGAVGGFARRVRGKLLG
ncbi:hypothetical protein [Rhizobium yanglingense]